MAALRNAQLQWRPATTADLPGIQKLSDEMHSSLPERPEVFAEKLALFQRGCFVLTWYEAMVGYSFSYPWVLRSIPPLDRLMGALPRSPGCLFIHDVVIQSCPQLRCRARVLVDLFVDLDPRPTTLSKYNSWLATRVVTEPICLVGVNGAARTNRHCQPWRG